MTPKGIKIGPIGLGIIATAVFAALIVLTFNALTATPPSGGSAAARDTLGPPPPDANRFIAQSASDSKIPEFVPGQMMVRFKAGSNESVRSTVRKRHGLTLVKRFAVDGLQLVELSTDDTVKEAAAALGKEDAIAYAEPNFIRRLSTTPNDSSFSNTWGMNNIGQTVNGTAGTSDADIDAPEAWSMFTGSSTAKVAVLDTGVDYLHADLAANIFGNPGETGGGKETNGIDDDGNGYVDDFRGYDFVGASYSSPAPDNNPMDVHGHGTHVAGTIAAVGNNNEGVAGVAWQARVIPVKVLDDAGYGSSAGIVQGYLYAANIGARVANGSFGGAGYSQSERDAIASATNTLFAIAAGNNNSDNETTPFYPCSYDPANIICVAASDQNDGRASFSNYGSTKVDLAAPGVNILSTKAAAVTGVPGNYWYLNGTSMAAPHVAGAATLLQSYDQTATTAQLKDSILSTVDAKPAFSGKTVTGGRLNLAAAMTALLPATGSSRAQVGNGRLTYTSGNGIASNLTISLSGSTYTVTDTTAAVAAGSGCTTVSATKVTCPSTGVTSVYVRTQDLNDTINSSSVTPATVYSGSGNDSITTGGGADVLVGEAGADVFVGNAGIDTVDYSAMTTGVNVTIDGTANDGAPSEGDQVGTTNENVIGGFGNDTLTGSTSVNILTGNAGNDTVNGGSGNDTLLPGAGTDTVDGGAGTDIASYSDRSTPVSISLDGTANDGGTGENDSITTTVEGLTGGGGGDTLIGSTGANTLNGGGGNDSIDGLVGADVFTGGTGVDKANYSSRTTALVVTLDGTANDGVSNEKDNVQADVEAISGGTANDTFTGSSADNEFDGGLGADVFNGGTGTDTVTYSTRTTALTVTVNGTANDGQAGENDNVKVDVENVTGGSGADTISGSTSANRLIGGGGNDQLNGLDGDDSIDGGTGADLFDGGNGTDTADYSSRQDWDGLFNGLWTGINVSVDGSANDGTTNESDNVQTTVENVTGTIASDVLTGSASANRLDGGYGCDTLTGLDGNDNLIGGPLVEYSADVNCDTNTLVGSNGNDTLDGTDTFAETFVAEPGADTMTGRSGGDTIDYSARTDNLTITLNSTNDDGSAGEGDDLRGAFYHMIGGSGNDSITGGSSFDGIDGGAGDDVINGGGYWDVLHGDAGNDLIDGGLTGTNDYLYSAYGDGIYGDAGVDTVTYAPRTNPVILTLDDVQNDGEANEKDYISPSVENLIGGAGGDTLTGNVGANVLDGGLGCDSITGSDGNDVLTAGPPSEDNASSCQNSLAGGIGDDTFNGTIDIENYVAEIGADTYNGNGGNDLLDYSARTANLTVTIDNVANDGDLGENDNVRVPYVYGGSGNDTLTGSSAGNVLDGGPGADILSGLLATDYLTGGDGDDTLDGGAKAAPSGSLDDAIYGGNGNDVATYASRTNPVTATLDGAQNDGESGENDFISTDVEGLTGGSGNDTLTGSPGMDTLVGGLGSDSVNGGDGNDTIQVKDGASDTVDCGLGTDVAFADLLAIDATMLGCETVNRS